MDPAVPRCAYCHMPFGGRPCVVGFCFCQFRYCGQPCLLAAEEERRRQVRAGTFSVERHRRRHWKVVDGNGGLVCVTVYRKGAEEVARRLGGRKPEVRRKVEVPLQSPADRPIDPIYRQKPLEKAA